MCILTTGRLVIRKFKPGDWKDLFEYLSDEAVVKYEPYDAYGEEECKKEAERRSNDEAFWAVCIKDSGKLIGNIYFERQKPLDFLAWEIGYVFNPKYCGRGYATESCRRMLELGFLDYGANRITAMCNPENISSWRLLERLGMRREATFKKNVYFKFDMHGNPLWVDTYSYAILKEEWIAISAGID